MIGLIKKQFEEGKDAMFNKTLFGDSWNKKKKTQ